MENKARDMTRTPGVVRNEASEVAIEGWRQATQQIAISDATHNE